MTLIIMQSSENVTKIYIKTDKCGKNLNKINKIFIFNQSAINK